MVELTSFDDVEGDADSSDNEEQYSKLLSSISQLDSTHRVRPSSRKELSTQVSEFHLSKATTGSGTVNVNELAEVLTHKTGHSEVSKKLKNVLPKSKTLPKPLEKSVADKIKRSVGFENVKNELQKWKSLIKSNQMKDQLTFPLKQHTLSVETTSQFLNQFKTLTPLEEQFAAILSEGNPEDAKPTAEDERNEYPLTLEELMEQRKEMAFLRARQSYKEAKAFRQSKIKSKKYHRIQRKEKIKQQLKDFEVLQKTDPEAALKKLEELDKNRALERASLRHRNTGKWAKNLTIRAKYDKKSRQELAQQLAISRDVTQKVAVVESSDEEENVADTTADMSISKNNPWAVSISSEVEEFISDYRKFWGDKNEKAKAEKSRDNEESDSVEEVKTKSKDEDLTLNHSPKKPIIQFVNNQGVEERKQSKPCLEDFICEKEPTYKKKKLKRNNKTDLKGMDKKKVRSKVNVSLKKSGQKSKKSVRLAASGSWLVSPVEQSEKRKRKMPSAKLDLDDIFDELDEKLHTNFSKKMKSLKAKMSGKEVEKEEVSEEEVDYDLALHKDRWAVERPDEDTELAETAGHAGPKVGIVHVPNLVLPTTEPRAEIDPTQYIKIAPKHLRTVVPDGITTGDDLDDEEHQQLTIMEAFGEDDVIAEFKQMKADEEEKTKLEEVTPSLPGWGEWGGTDIVPTKKKQRRFVTNLPPRKDARKVDMIINERENPKMVQHLVKEVPFPFKSVAAFESSIRAPVSREFVPETAFKRLIEPSVVTLKGSVIEPMNEAELVRFKLKPRSRYKGKAKNKC